MGNSCGCGFRSQKAKKKAKKQKKGEDKYSKDEQNSGVDSPSDSGIHSISAHQIVVYDVSPNSSVRARAFQHRIEGRELHVHLQSMALAAGQAVPAESDEAEEDVSEAASRKGKEEERYLGHVGRLISRLAPRLNAHARECASLAEERRQWFAAGFLLPRRNEFLEKFWETVVVVPCLDADACEKRLRCSAGVSRVKMRQFNSLLVARLSALSQCDAVTFDASLVSSSPPSSPSSSPAHGSCVVAGQLFVVQSQPWMSFPLWKHDAEAGRHVFCADEFQSTIRNCVITNFSQEAAKAFMEGQGHAEQQQSEMMFVSSSLMHSEPLIQRISLVSETANGTGVALSSSPSPTDLLLSSSEHYRAAIALSGCRQMALARDWIRPAVVERMNEQHGRHDGRGDGDADEEQVWLALTPLRDSLWMICCDLLEARWLDSWRHSPVHREFFHACHALLERRCPAAAAASLSPRLVSHAVFWFFEEQFVADCRNLDSMFSLFVRFLGERLRSSQFKHFFLKRVNLLDDLTADQLERIIAALEPLQQQPQPQENGFAAEVERFVTDRRADDIELVFTFLVHVQQRMVQMNGEFGLDMHKLVELHESCFSEEAVRLDQDKLRQIVDEQSLVVHNFLPQIRKSNMSLKFHYFWTVLVQYVYPYLDLLLMTRRSELTGGEQRHSDEDDDEDDDVDSEDDEEEEQREMEPER